MAHSGRVIFLAAAVMIAVFLDAFLVRLILVRVLLRLTGEDAWWLPKWLDKVLPRVNFAHG